MIAFLSVGGVTLGVAVLIVVTAVNEGFATDLRTKILGNQAHLVVRAERGGIANADELVGRISAIEGVVAAAPFTSADVMLLGANGRASGAILKGIDPVRGLAVTDVAGGLVAGPRGAPEGAAERRMIVETLHTPAVAALQAIEDTALLPGILLGDGLAEVLGVYPGDRVTCVNPHDPLGAVSGLVPPGVRVWRVAALLHTGMYEVDAKGAYVLLADAQDFSLAPGIASGIEVRLAESRVLDAPAIARALAAELGSTLQVRDWLTVNDGLFKALTLQKWVMALILSQIIAVAALGIVTNLIVLVVTRSREIAILRAIGASARMIRTIFVIEGVAVGTFGAVAGVLVGLGACWALARYEFPLDGDVYYLESLPVLVRPAGVVAVAVGTVLISFLATLYPSWRAARVHPADGLRYD